MIGTSAAFRVQVSGPHEVVSVVEVVRDGAVVTTLPVHAGSVDADRSNRILRRFSASVADPDGNLTPEGIRDLLAPFGTIVRLHRGVRIPVITTVRVVDDTQAELGTGTLTDLVATAAGDLELG